MAHLAVYRDLQLNMMVIPDPIAPAFTRFLLDRCFRLVFSLYILWKTRELLFVRGITEERYPLVLVPDRCYRKQ